MTRSERPTHDRSIARGTCPLDCPDTCSWEITVENGVAVGIRGTADHPFTRGNLCAKVDRYIEHMHAPDRLLHPLKRVGPKGSGAFERISWDEAIATFADRLATIKEDHGGEAIWPYAGCGSMGFLQGIVGVGARLWNTLGASHHEPTICHHAGSHGTAYTMGSRHGLDPEAFAHARLIVIWGANPLTTHNHVWRFISQAREAGAHLVVIDPVRSRTAARADEHISIVPGTDAALALGLLNVVVTMGAEDQAFIAENTIGWSAYRERILAFPPERVAQITGIPAAQIRTLGERLARTRPTAILTRMGIQRHAGGGMALRTIMTIPGVTGDWQHLGGGAVYSTGAYFGGNIKAFLRPDLRAKPARTLIMTRLGEGLLDLDDPPVKALVVLGANPAASNPDQGRVRKGLARDDLFTVVIDHFKTDTADFADLVLPTTMQPEHTDLHNAYGHLYLHLNEPAVRPQGECLPSTEIFRRLAAALGLTDPALFATDEELVRSILDSGHPSVEGITLERLREQGWLRLNYPRPAKAYPFGFPTPSGKIEFLSERAAADGLDPLPDYTPPREVTSESTAARFPLVLISPASHFFLNSMFANKPDLLRKAGPIKVSLHADDAAARGIAHGSPVRVFNDRGAFVAQAEITDTVRRGVAVTPKGYWPKLVSGGTNVNATVEERDSDMGHGAVFHDNRVDVLPINPLPSPVAAE